MEAYPKSRKAQYRGLIRLVQSLDYAVHEISEGCGWPADCRNYVCVPSERHEIYMRTNGSASASGADSWRAFLRPVATIVEQ